MSLIMGLDYFGLDMVIIVLGLKSEFWRPLLCVEVKKIYIGQCYIEVG